MIRHSRTRWSRLLDSIVAVALLAAFMPGSAMGARPAGGDSAVPNVRAAQVAAGAAALDRAVVSGAAAADAPSRLLVRFEPSASPAARAAEARTKDFRAVKDFTSIGWTVVEPLPGRSGEALFGDLSRSPLVDLVEYDVQATVAATPNDPLYSGLWGMHNVGQQGGTQDVDINAPEAWDVETGSDGIVVAVVDTGVDLGHEDLAGNAWVNPGEIAGDGIDNDGNGYIDDVHGWDFRWDDASVYDVADEDRHGTHVAGTIGAVGDNEVGVAGVNWNISIMACKFITPSRAYVSDAAEAILYAVDNGADVINHSWSAQLYSSVLDDAMDYAAERGVINVAASANDGINIDSTPRFPASLDATNLISVAAIDRDDTLAPFSNYGVNSVDLAAPGAEITSTVPVVASSLHVVDPDYEVVYHAFSAEALVDPADSMSLIQDSMAVLDSSGVGAVFIVDDSRPSYYGEPVGARLSVYTSALSAAGYTDIVTWNTETQGTPTIGDIAGRPLVWFTAATGYYWDPVGQSLDASDRAVIGAYLDAGGRLLLSGGDIGLDLNYFTSSKDPVWYATYLHAAMVSYDSYASDLNGVSGGPLEGFSGTADPVEMDDYWPSGADTIRAIDGSATPLINWGGYGALDGTSMAAPHVTGAIALLLASDPALTGEGARVHIEQTVRPVPALDGKVATGGRLDLAAALTGYPAAPAPLEAVAGVDGDAALSWMNPTDSGFSATRVVRDFGAWPAGPDDGTVVYEGPASAVSDNLLPHGADVRYAAFTRDRWGGWSAPTTASITAVDVTAPETPGSFSATRIEGHVELHWTNPDSPDLAGVRILSRVGAEPTGPDDALAEPVYQGLGSTWLDVNVFSAPEDKTVHYAAYSFDTAQNFSDAATDVVTADLAPPVGTFVILDDDEYTTDPAISLDSAVTGAAEMRFDLGNGWGDWVAYADSFEGTLVGGDGARTVLAQYRDTSDNILSLSDAIMLDTVAPAAPTGLQVTATSNGAIAMEWTLSTHEDVVAQVLQRAQGDSGTWSTIATLGSTASGYSDTGLENRMTYRYRIGTIDGAGHVGSFSSEVSGVPGAALVRAAGANRYGTAIAVSSSTFDAADTVVIATGEDFPDALGASGLAGLLDAPVLLTPRAMLPAGLLDEIDRLGSTKVIIIGGYGAVSADVQSQLESSGLFVRRISGANRYGTAAAVAREVMDLGGAADVLIARGDGFADALAAGPLAYSAGLPILLVSQTAVPADTAAALAGGSATHAVVLGGTGAVPDAVASALGIEFDRVGGVDRYGTAVAVADYGVSRGWAEWGQVGLATGLNFADALAGGAALGQRGGVLLLTRPDALPGAVFSALEARAGEPDALFVPGGAIVVTDAVAQEALDAIDGQ